MAFNEKELEIIKYGLQNGKSKDDVQNALIKYRTGDITPTIKTTKEPSESTALGRISDVISKAGEDVESKISSQDGTALTRGVEATARGFRAIPEVAVAALPEEAGQALGVVGEKIGKGFEWLTNKISDTGAIKAIAKLSETNPEAYKAIEEALRTSSAGGEIAGTILTVDQGVKGTQKGVDKIKEVAQDIKLPKVDMPEISPIVNKAPADIMQRVARIPKGAQAKFQKTAGESVGEYLSNRGIYGDVDDISNKLYERFNTSKLNVDKALEQLPGEFKPTSVKTALKEVLKRETAVSSEGAQSTIAPRVKELLKKFDDTGLTHSEVNEAKRLFEKNVRVDYSNPMTASAEKIEKMTRIDSAMRAEQLQNAVKSGFKNLDEMNRETRLAKSLLDSIGKEYYGQAGNNALGLTDWIMLSGGDPTAVAGFLAKKTLSSKKVQSVIAKTLAGKKPVKGDVKAVIEKP